MTNKAEIARLKLIADALYQRDQARLLKINSQIRDERETERQLKARKLRKGFLEEDGTSDPLALARWMRWSDDGVARSHKDQNDLATEREELAGNASRSLGRVNAIEELDAKLQIEERRKQERR